jgi:tellurite resistance protein TehA-like permease
MPTLLSKTSNHTLPPIAGDIFSALGFLTALILWGFGLSWLFFALTSIVYTRKFPFNIGWWGFTFPLGVFAMSTCQIGRELGSKFFLVLGTVSFYIICCKPVIVETDHDYRYFPALLFCSGFWC